MISKLLVPVDGSESSKKALEFACGIATKFNAELTLLHVIESGAGEQTLVMGTAHVTIPAAAEQIKKTAHSLIAAATEIAKNNGCDVSQSRVVNGSAARSILEAAEDESVDTIIMGSRGLGGISGMLLGSVSHKVNHLAKCTCITVR